MLHMEFWKFAAITTWIALGIISLTFFVLRKKWVLFSKDVILGRISPEWISMRSLTNIFLFNMLNRKGTGNGRRDIVNLE